MGSSRSLVCFDLLLPPLSLPFSQVFPPNCNHKLLRTSSLDDRDMTRQELDSYLLRPDEQAELCDDKAAIMDSDDKTDSREPKRQRKNSHPHKSPKLNQEALAAALEKYKTDQTDGDAGPADDLE
jgi:hypothetical protein